MEVEMHICEGDSIYLGKTFRKVSGYYYDTLLSHYDCDSVIISHLRVLPSYSVFLDSAICFGDSIYFNDTYLTDRVFIIRY